MPKSTKLFEVIPWTGGINTNQNAGLIDPTQLTIADNLMFIHEGAKQIREGIEFGWDDGLAEGEKIVGLTQFYYESGTGTKASILVGVSSNQKIYSYNTNGDRTELTFEAGQVAYSDSINFATFVTIGSRLIICVDGEDNVVKYWEGPGNEVKDLPEAPKASICAEHLGRLWLNDKSDVDRVHYSQTGDTEKWQGQGDSGALDIVPGDNDSHGITTIFPTFKGDLHVAKRTKIYRISGLWPETFAVNTVSDGIGCIAHNSAVAVDNDDIFFCSERGVHSLVTTSNYGDFKSKFLSRDIHPTYTNDFGKEFFQNLHGVYLPELQSVGFNFQQDEYEVGQCPNTIWFYHITQRAWYRWPNIACNCMSVVQDTDRKRLYLGGGNDETGGTGNKVSKALTGDFKDILPDDTEVPIDMLLKTGIIYLEGRYLVKAYKKFAVYYQPEDTHVLNVSVRIDNHSQQNLTFSAEIATDTLGVDFILGQSVLGTDIVLSPYTRPIDGYGRGIQITMSQSTVDTFVEIQGFAIEYENAGTAQEVVIVEE
jgi:hypothetical protein